MFYGDSLELLSLLLITLFSTSDSTIDLNMPELQYLSDHLTQEECHKLIAALHFETFEVPQQVAAAERRLPEDVPCLELLLHWNSEAGEGKGGTHVEVSHRLNQIGRRDLAQWLSKTVFHELSKELEEPTALLVTEETTRRPPTRITEAPKPTITDEAPWLNLDSILALLVILAITTCAFGSVYLLCLCCMRMRTQNKHNVYDKLPNEQIRKVSVPAKKESGKEQTKKESVQSKKASTSSGSSDDETAKLISNKKNAKES